MLKLLGQLMLPITDPVAYLEAMTRTRDKRRAARRLNREAIATLRTRILEFTNSEQLDLFSGEPTPSVISPVAADRDLLNEIATNWDDREIVHLCDGLVQSTLEGLRDFKDKARRIELLLWMAPDARADEAFSFDMCCQVCGLDAENIRSFVSKTYRDEISRYVADENAIQELPQSQTSLTFA